jgi:hypothetical protein
MKAFNNESTSHDALLKKPRRQPKTFLYCVLASQIYYEPNFPCRPVDCVSKYYSFLDIGTPSNGKSVAPTQEYNRAP